MKRLTPQRDRYGRLVCNCAGYWFPHRRAGGACDHSKSRDIHLARRTGDPELMLQALVAFFWDHPAKPTTGPPPF